MGSPDYEWHQMKRRWCATVAYGGAVFAALLWCSACGAEKIPPVRHNLAPAKRFRPFTLYHAGRTFSGLPMTGDGSIAVRRYYRGQPVRFTYGQCVPSGEHHNCNPPVDIINYPICYFPGPNPSPHRVYRIRGRRVGVYYDYGHFDLVELQTGKTTIVIHAHSPAQALAVVRRLRAANADIAPGDPLPPPRRVTPSLRRTLCG
jgi:hypothetical protein